MNPDDLRQFIRSCFILAQEQECTELEEIEDLILSEIATEFDDPVDNWPS